MVLIDDLIIGFSAAVATASLVILGVLLSRYRTLARDAAKADQLAKDIWDSMNTRLSTQDTRIVDLMARFEVYATRNKANLGAVSATKWFVNREKSQESQPNVTTSQLSTQVQPESRSGKRTNETEDTILKALIEGPKTSNQIREIIDVTREHNGRLLKDLFDRGLVTRNMEHKPFVYEITEEGRRSATA